MIGTKIQNPNKAASKRLRITALIEYMRQPEDHNATEKCVHAGVRNFVTRTPANEIAEMVALAERAPRSRDPLEHYVLSWRKDERPTPAQVDAAIDTLRTVMQIERLLFAYALHADTEHWHVHVAVLRVDPETGRPVQIHRGFDVDALQRAVALIEHQQGWQVEANSRWKVDRGRIVPVDPEPPAPDRPNRPPRPKRRRQRGAPQPRRDVSHRTGQPSVIAQAIEALAPAFREARSWPELHAALRAREARYDLAPNRQGAIVTWRGVTFKASAIHPSVSLRALERQFGAPYQPDPTAGVTRSPMIPARAWQLIAPARDRGEGWQPIHDALAPYGLTYAEAGSGARISSVHDPDWTMTASRVHRHASRKHLEQALGPYEPPGPAARATLEQARQQVAAKAAAPDFSVAVAIIEAVASWRELHAELAARGFRYDRKGSGATLTHGAFTVKASSVSRKISLGALQRRLGPYEPSTEPAPARAASAAGETDPERDAHERQRDAERAERDAARLADDARHDQELAELKARQAAERAEALAGDWTGRGQALNKRRSQLAAKHRRERQRLAEQRRLARKELARNHPQPPPYHAWRRAAALEVDVRPNTPILRPVAIVGFVGVKYRHHVDYIRQDDPDQRVSFRDHGRSIHVLQSRNEQAVLAALRVAQARCQGRPIVVRGSERFRELSRRLAGEHGIAIIEAPTRQRTPAASGDGPRPEAPTPSPGSHAPPGRPPPGAVPEPGPPESRPPEPDRERETRPEPPPAPDPIHEPDRRPSAPNLLPAICPCDAGGTPEMPDVNARPPATLPPALAGYTAQRLDNGRFVEYLRTDANNRRIVIGCDAGSLIAPTPAASMADLRALLQAAADRWTHIRSQQHCADRTMSRIGKTGYDRYFDALRHVAAQHDIARLVWPQPQFVDGIGKHWDDAPWRRQVHGRGGPREGGGVGAR